jgi:tetratricopeptide (TPR) repeat protein
VAVLSQSQPYTRENVLRMLNVSERQLKSWEKQGFIAGGDAFSFADITALRTLLRLREKKVPTRTIGEALASLRRRLSDVEHPLAQLKIGADGKRISVQIAGQKMEAISGQFFFDFDVDNRPAVTAFPGKSRAVLDREAEHWFQQGLTFEETGAPVDLALQAYAKAIELNPNAAGALVNLGTIYFRMNKLPKAEACYRKAVEADPNYPLAHFNLANLYDERGDTELARTHYLTSIRLNPRYGDAYFNLALLAEQAGETLKAVGYWNAYLKLDSGSTWAQVARRQLERLKQVAVVGRA